MNFVLRNGIFPALFCLLAPPAMMLLGRGKARKVILLLYSLAVLGLTVGERLFSIALGLRAFDAARQINLIPFWSYARFDQADIRWQVYMNVLLFLPFGFMLPWAAEGLRRLWKVILIAAAFSVLTEAAQYLLCIGLCETDDVIHNALGTGLGYGYWRLLRFLRDRFRGETK